jgi:hypothetical protein
LVNEPVAVPVDGADHPDAMPDPELEAVAEPAETDGGPEAEASPDEGSGTPAETDGPAEQPEAAASDAGEDQG